MAANDGAPDFFSGAFLLTQLLRQAKFCVVYFSQEAVEHTKHLKLTTTEIGEEGLEKESSPPPLSATENCFINQDAPSIKSHKTTRTHA